MATATGMTKFPLYRSAVGLVDKLDSLRVPYFAESGVTGFSRADDVVFDVTGAPSRRNGFSLLSSGVVSSVFSCGHYGVCVKDGYLSIINEDWTVTATATTLGKKVAWERVFDGKDDVVFYSDGVKVGRVVNRASTTWTVGSYVGVNSTAAQVRQFLSAVPAGHILRIFNGRMYVAVDNILFISEPYAFSWFDALTAFVFDRKITMVNAVQSGLFVGTTEEVVFMAGSGPQDFARVKALSSGAVFGSDVGVTAAGVGVQSGGDVLFFVSSGVGFCRADSTGLVSVESFDSINFPVAGTAAGFVDSYKQYLVSLL